MNGTYSKDYLLNFDFGIRLRSGTINAYAVQVEGGEETHNPAENSS